MRILYINSAFSGPVVPLAQFIARRRTAAAVFLAERWPRVGHLPNIMRVRLPAAAPSGTTGTTGVEGMMLRTMRNALNVVGVCQHLRTKGFVPDVVYGTAQDGYLYNIAEVFPHARIVTRLDSFFGTQTRSRPCDDCTPGQRTSSYACIHDAFQLAVLAGCTAGVTSSQWQKSLLDSGFGHKVHVVPNGVDTQAFRPDPAKQNGENILFSCQGTQQERGIAAIGACLPELLARRAGCRVRIVSFASRRSAEARMEHARALAALLPPLSEQARARVDVYVSPEHETYVDLLQRATVYVYLTAPTLLSAGLLEAMSCGALVLAADTGPVREIVRDGHNGLLWQGQGQGQGEGLADALVRILEKVEKNVDYNEIKSCARQSILAQYASSTILPRHEALVIGA